MAGDVQLMEHLLRGLSAEDRAKVANAGGLEADAAGDNALHYACWKGQTAAAVWLVRCCGSDINQAGRAGLTPLHWAVRGAAETTISWLIEEGASLEIRDKAGQTPLDTCLGFLDDEAARTRAEIESADLRGANREEDTDRQRIAASMRAAKLMLIDGESKQQRLLEERHQTQLQLEQYNARGQGQLALENQHGHSNSAGNAEMLATTGGAKEEGLVATADDSLSELVEQHKAVSPTAATNTSTSKRSGGGGIVANASLALGLPPSGGADTPNPE